MSRFRNAPNDCKVYIGDLSRDANEKDIERAFREFGPLKSVWVARNPPGFAFVEFEDYRDAEDSVKELDGTHIAGARVRVEMSSGKVRPKPWMRGGVGGRGPPRGNRGFNPDDRCYECGERGHYAYDCSRKRGGGGGGGGGGGRSRRRSYSRSRSRSRSRGRRDSRSRSRSPVQQRSPSPQ